LAPDRHFDTRLAEQQVTLTIEDFLEFGIGLVEDPSHLPNKGVFPCIQKNNEMDVHFLFREKRQNANSSSKCGDLGKWE
jgi:hypothetical protein